MRRVIAGGYAAQGAQGLYLLEHEPGRLMDAGIVAPACNVSAGVAGIDGERWFFVDEMTGTLLLYDSAQGWREIARVASGGREPCHLALDHAGRRLAVAHYGSGTTASFRLDANGVPSEAPALYQHHSHGPVADRQDGAHAHWVGFDAHGRLYVTDLGTDQILLFEDGDKSLSVPRIAYVAPPGSGPRQIAFHPSLPIAYLVSELAVSLTVLDVAEDGTLSERCVTSTLPPGVERGETLGGAILLHADRVHVSNRGHDSIATFAIDDAGDVRLLAVHDSGGRSPRFLLIDDGRLLVAHEEAGGVTMLPLDRDGVPCAVDGRVDVPGAAFLGVLP